jgi:small subunit ribosomal protein S21
MIRVQVRPNEPFEAALRRFKRQCNYAGIFRLAKKHAYHEKSSDKRGAKSASAAQHPDGGAQARRWPGDRSQQPKRRTTKGKPNDRRNNDAPDFDPLTADTTIQKTDS